MTRSRPPGQNAECRYPLTAGNRHATPVAPRRWAPRCRRCWWRPAASPPRWHRVCMAVGVSDRVTVSGSSAPSFRETRWRGSIGANPRSRTAPSSADRVGGGADRLPMGRCLGQHALALPPRPGGEGERAALLLLALAALLLRGGERVRLDGAGRTEPWRARGAGDARRGAQRQPFPRRRRKPAAAASPAAPCNGGPLRRLPGIPCRPCSPLSPGSPPSPSPSI